MSKNPTHTVMLKKEKELTEDEMLRYKYIKLLIRALKYSKNYSPNTFEFYPEDKQVIEYYLRDVARHAVLEETSTEECLAMFIGRITRLVSNDSAEWSRVFDLVRRHQSIVSQEEITEMDGMFKYFKKQTVSA